MSILLVAEHAGNQLKPATYALVSAAQKISSAAINLLLVGKVTEEVVQDAARIAGVAKVLYAGAEQEIVLGEDLAETVLSVAADYNYIIFANSTLAKAAAPRVAAKLGVEQLSEIVQVIDGNNFVRPLYTSSVLAQVRLETAQKVLTVRVSAFGRQVGTQEAVAVEKVAFVAAKVAAKVVSYQPVESDMPELTSAPVVVAGGRGFASKEEFEQLLLPVARKLNAAVGASRAIVDLGFVPNDWQVGQTGKMVAPQLYLAVGISGAVQHQAGIKDAVRIIAINADEQAPIFSIADYGLVADLKQVLPQLLELI